MSVNKTPPIYVHAVNNNKQLTNEYRRFFERLIYDLDLSQEQIGILQAKQDLLGVESVPDSTAVTVADLVTDFNNLLAKLRTAGVIT